MLVVPIANDKITTFDADEFTVTSYTNLKSEPAVYIEAPRGQLTLVYFSDIDQINNVKVEYNKTNKVFEALGVVKRKIHIPQQHDKITVKNSENPDDKESITVEVKLLKLHNSALGLSKGLVVVDKEDNVYELQDIEDIDRAIGEDEFNTSRFLKIYKDYISYRRD